MNNPAMLLKATSRFCPAKPQTIYISKTSTRYTMAQRRIPLYFCLLILLLSIISIQLADASPIRPTRAGLTPASVTPLRRDTEDLGELPQPVILTTSCVYPVSGTYTRFQRILYYVVIVIVFNFRFHKGVLVAGAAWLAGYTVPASIHAIALGAKAGSGVDADLLAVSAVCQVGFGAGVIFSMWPSKHFRRSSSPILIFWTLLLLSAKLVAYWGSEVFYGDQLTLDIGLGSGFQDPNPGHLLQVCTAVCAAVEVVPVMFRTAADELAPYACETLDISREDLDCMYGALELGDSFDFGNNTVRVSVSDASQDVYDLSLLSPASITLLIVVGLLLTSTTIGADFSPRVCRNWIYRRLTVSDPPRIQLKTPRYILCVAITFLFYVWQILSYSVFPLMAVDILAYLLYLWATDGRGLAGVWRLRIPEHKPTGIPSTPKRRFAIALPMVWYTWVTLGYLIFPAFMMYIIYGQELFVNDLPEQEVPVGVGQWGAWVDIGVALLLALYPRLKPDRNGDASKSNGCTRASCSMIPTPGG